MPLKKIFGSFLYKYLKVLNVLALLLICILVLITSKGYKLPLDDKNINSLKKELMVIPYTENAIRFPIFRISDKYIYIPKFYGINKFGLPPDKNIKEQYGTPIELEFKNTLEEENTPVFDVRKESEFIAEHIDDAHNTPLDFINDYLAEFPTDKTFYVHCAGGYRSVIAASILKSRGIHNLIDIAGGFKDIKEVGIKTTDYVCPSTIK